MTDFLSNVAGQTLLSIVARGSAIIAELRRLSDHIPKVFLRPANDAKSKYAPIILDFKYLKNPDEFEDRIEKDEDTAELDEEFRENHLPLLERFYSLFESIHKYISDWLAYLEELKEGTFVQHTTEGVLLDVEGKQLMAEALYLYGCMLLLLDLRVPGLARERMLISYYRYKGAATIPNIDEVCKLCRSTGYSPTGRRPAKYPEEYFARIKIPKEVIKMIVSRLRSDDVYNRRKAYPSPEHRSTALATQSAMLYTILYFAPSVLEGQHSMMREIVDKHFNDNWVVPFQMGFAVDLSQAWEPYKAARAALDNILHKQNIQDVTSRYAKSVHKLNAGLLKYLTKGVLTEAFVMNHIRVLVHHARECNVTLRWFLLQRTTMHRKYRELVRKAISVNQLLDLMTNTAQFELSLKNVLQQLLNTKEERWEHCKAEAKGRLDDLSEYFSGEKALTRVKRNANLQAWFKKLSEQVGALDFGNAVVAGRNIAHLIRHLEEVEQFHQIETSLQVKSFLQDTREYMTRMIKTANVTDSVLADLETISDFAYACEVINDYTQHLHYRIKSKPSTVLLLRATFLKLSSVLSLPLVRITQCGSKDDISVAEYYSKNLVLYIRKVLEIVPQSVFNTLAKIIDLLTHKMVAVPTKIERLHLGNYSQLEHRYTLAKATHQVSVFTRGILNMKTTLVGIVQLDPRQLLEDGIRKELVRRIAVALHQRLVFGTGKLQDFEARLKALGDELTGFKRSFEYIQDYIHMYGLKIWQEEFSRIIAYNVEQECNAFLKKKVFDWQSVYQSDAIPIPQFQPYDKASVNFMGRLVRELLAQCDPKKTVYIECNQGWYNNQLREVVGIRTFDFLYRGVGVFGLCGVDRLVCFMIVRDLHVLTKTYRRNLDFTYAKMISGLMDELSPTSALPRNAAKLYQHAIDKLKNLIRSVSPLVIGVGTAQLLRRQVANQLNFLCKLDSKLLSCSLATVNDSLINDVKAHYLNPEAKAYPANPILPEVSKHLETAGFNNPLSKIYITSEPLHGLACVMFLFVLDHLTKVKWNKRISTLVGKNPTREGIDGGPLVVGVITVLKQFHSSHTTQFVGYLAQYVNVCVSAESTAKGGTLPTQAILALLFLEQFCSFSKMSRKVVDSLVPAYLLDRFTHE
uniref:WASH complex subunit strumpellin n=1 Tax=Lotharella globosa TaxID=91324 RepID=A0A7S3YNZ3_9EUKA|mmetsp:Transcript_24555/g.47954  ORF Transcript_24555/g.47954 Transcript_24555/m.47954 type:complete len:1141 (+) Transcript_24555:65-3487(+)